MKKLLWVFFVLLANLSYSADYPDMTGQWIGTIRTVSTGEQVRAQVARGGALIQDQEIHMDVSYQDREVFIGETTANVPDSTPISIWGAIRSTGKEGVFVTANGGRGNIWFTAPGTIKFCFANQTQEQMSAYCGMLRKQ
jgi:hypothetical protein